MYEHVKTGCKHIPSSEQPLQFQSGYYLNKPRIYRNEIRRFHGRYVCTVDSWVVILRRHYLNAEFEVLTALP